MIFQEDDMFYSDLLTPLFKFIKEIHMGKLTYRLSDPIFLGDEDTVIIINIYIDNREWYFLLDYPISIRSGVVRGGEIDRGNIKYSDGIQYNREVILKSIGI